MLSSLHAGLLAGIARFTILAQYADYAEMSELRRMDRRCWVVTMELHSFVWAHGDYVQVFGRVEYVRRLTGLTTEVTPHTVRTVTTGFDSYESYRRWCREQNKTLPS